MCIGIIRLELTVAACFQVALEPFQRTLTGPIACVKGLSLSQWTFIGISRWTFTGLFQWMFTFVSSGVQPSALTAANLRTKILYYRGLDSSEILMLRGGVPRPTGELPGRFEPTNLSREFLVG